MLCFIIDIEDICSQCRHLDTQIFLLFYNTFNSDCFALRWDWIIGWRGQALQLLTITYIQRILSSCCMLDASHLHSGHASRSGSPWGCITLFGICMNANKDVWMVAPTLSDVLFCSAALWGTQVYQGKAYIQMMVRADSDLAALCQHYKGHYW